MKNWVIQHIHALTSTLRRLLGAPMSNALNILVTGIALSLPAGMHVLLQDIQNLTDQIAGPRRSAFS